MGKRIKETLKAGVQVRLTTSAGKMIFEGIGGHARLELFQPEHLLKIIKA